MYNNKLEIRSTVAKGCMTEYRG